jgi:nucleotide-binding universal stress UspA family protein
MKTVVVATDFSPPAENAMMFAGRLAESLGASILLVHAYQLPVSMNDAPIVMIEAEDLGAHTEQNLQRAKEALQKQYPKLEIKTESRLGDSVDEITALCREVQPLFLVQGRHHKSGVESFIFGSTSLSMIRHCKSPLISVPDSFSTGDIKNIGIAVDAAVDELPMQSIAATLKPFNASLHIVHINEKDESQIAIEGLSRELNASYVTLSAAGFIEGIEQFVRQHHIDMLCIVPHKHSVVERLLFKTHTSKLMHRLSLPILCIPG